MVFLTTNLAQSPRSVCDLFPPVGHRGVIHGGHTELAGLRGVADLNAALLLGAHLGCGDAAFRASSQWRWSALLEAHQLSGAAQILWDSIGTTAGGRSNEGRVVARLGANAPIASWNFIGPPVSLCGPTREKLACHPQKASLPTRPSGIRLASTQTYGVAFNGLPWSFQYL